MRASDVMRWITVYADGPGTIGRQVVGRLRGNPVAIPDGPLPHQFHPFTGLILHAGTGVGQQRALVTTTLQINVGNFEWISQGNEVALLAKAPFELIAQVPSPLATVGAGGYLTLTFRFAQSFIGPPTGPSQGHLPYRCTFTCEGFTPSMATPPALDDLLTGWWAFRDFNAAGECPAVLGENGSRIARADEPMRYHFAFKPVVVRDAPGSPLERDRTPYALELLAGARGWRAAGHPWPAPPPVHAPLLAPFGIRPRGAIEAGVDPQLPIDFRARERIEFLLAGAGQASWDLDAYWMTSRAAPSPTDGHDTPTAAWNRLAAAHRGALEGTRPSAAASMLPELEEAESQSWAISYVATPSQSQRDRWAFARPRLRLHDFRTEPTSVVTSASLRGFRAHDGLGLARRYKLTDIDARAEDQIAVALLDQVGAASAPAATPVRIGALDLIVGKHLEPANPHDDPWATTTEIRAHAKWVEGNPTTVAVALDGLRVAVIDVLPGAQDPTELESLAQLDRVSGLVFHPHPAALPIDPTKPAYVLSAGEHATDKQDHQLSLVLERDRTVAVDEEPYGLIVLDEAPLTIARISLVRGRILSAVWTSRGLEGTAWAVIDDGNDTDLQLPPQVLGEEMLKRYDEGDFHPVIAKPFPFKFSQTARFQIGRRILDTHSGEPAWNLRRLFGWAGQRSPGASLGHLDVELLYGLQVSADPRDLRLVELGAALGEPRDPRHPETRGDQAFLAKHVKLLALTRSRPSLLYVAQAAAPFERTTIEEGLRFQLRPTREVVHPIDVLRTAAVTPTMTYRPRDAGGLAGGVDWGFESLNIYDEVRRTPSTGGRLANAAFTAFGGFGSQKAAFANDKTRIYADTELGRTTRYALERVGRIGVLHHPAKHVIEYERTVDDSQFIRDDQGTWAQRPILRKVREYVKLDLPTRAFPDGDEPEASRGFVLAAHFASVEIPVDSRWGHDLPGGWIVPLFKHGDPNITKRPDIRLQLATSAEPVWAHIGNPEDLVFYTTTDEKLGSDTTTWPTVPGVDFPAADLPKIDTDERAVASDARQSAPPALHAGYERFTYRLEGLGARVNMLAGRAEAIVEAALENVTLARRGLKQSTLVPPPALTRAREAVTAFEADARAAFASAGDIEQLKTTLGQHLATASATLLANAKLVDQLKDRQQALLAQWPPAEWMTETTKAIARIQQHITDGLKTKELAVAAELGDLGRRMYAVPSVLKELGDRAQRAIVAANAFGERLDALRAEWIGRLARARASARDDAERAREGARELFALFDATVERVRQLGEQIPGIAAEAVRAAIGNLAQKLRAELPAIDWKSDLSPLVNRLIVQVRTGAVEIRKAAEAARDAVPWNPGEAHELIRLLREDGHRTLLADLGALPARLATDLTLDATGAVGKVRAYATAQLAGLPQTAIDAIGGVETIAKAKEAADQLAELYGAVGTALAHAPDVMAAVRERLVDSVGKQLTAGRDEIERRIEQASTLAFNDVKDLGDRTMRLVRAFGEAPVAQALALSRDRIAYVFHEVQGDAIRLASIVGITPSAVLMNRDGIEIPGLPLKTLGVRLPTFSIGDRFIPDLRNELKLDQIFPDFAGLRLDKLFEGVGFPSFAADGVAIRHGVDPKTRSAWASADVLVPISDATVFDVSAFKVRLVNARFEAHTRVSAELGGGVQRTVDGRISGDWRLEVAGQLVAALNRAELSFDGTGKLHFHVSPQGIAVAEALQFLTTLLAYAPSGNGSGLAITPVFPDGGGSIPIGISAAINLALPVISSGAFSISNLALAAHFDLRIGDDGFQIGAGLNFASEERPFNLSVLFLGGGGWLETGVTYSPFGSGASKTHARVSIGLAVGASLPFDIGVARGGVSLLLSIGVVWTTPAGRVEIVLAITLRGELVLLSIVSVGVYLRLEARYVSGGNGIECTGYMSIKIKIGWFFKISVEHRVSFRLAGGSSTRTRALRATASPTAESAVTDYLNGYES